MLGKIINCAVCGKQFKPHDKQSKYCSNDCYNSVRSRGLPKKSVCKNCGITFECGRGNKGVFCSKQCSGRYSLAVIAERKRKAQEEQLEFKRLKKEVKEQLKEIKQRIERLENIIKHRKTCGECGKNFIAKHANSMYCSKKCRSRNKTRKEDRRIYKNGKPDLSITLTKLYLRDKGICQICGRHINFDCDSNSNHYPSIDHIKPIAKGGLHSWDNVQLACRICNSRKQDTY